MVQIHPRSLERYYMNKSNWEQWQDAKRDFYLVLIEEQPMKEIVRALIGLLLAIADFLGKFLQIKDNDK